MDSDLEHPGSVENAQRGASMSTHTYVYTTFVSPVCLSVPPKALKLNEWLVSKRFHLWTRALLSYCPDTCTLYLRSNLRHNFLLRKTKPAEDERYRTDSSLDSPGPLVMIHDPIGCCLRTTSANIEVVAMYGERPLVVFRAWPPL